MSTAHYPIRQVNTPFAALQVGSCWPGYRALKHLIIFGDSYSDIGYSSTSPSPSGSNPLGVPFPGLAVTTPGEPNWVGCLVKRAEPNTILVHDYAVQGHNVKGITTQICREFLPNLGKKPPSAPWNAQDTLFITWIGVNDCAFRFTFDPTKSMEVLFEQQEILYATGARNFMFIDVPPVNRAPAVPKHLDRSGPFNSWNDSLTSYAQLFASSHPDATVLVYSSWTFFTKILDDPEAYGFPEKDQRAGGGKIWWDKLHPTAAVHKILADDILNFLENVGTYSHGDLS